MIMRKTLLTSTALACAVAFENQPGWKMDGDKIAVDGDGNPIYVNSSGNEMSVKHDTIATLNAEAKQHRTAKEAAEQKLKAFEGIDPDKARAAIDTVSNIDAKKLIDAGEVEKVRDEIKHEYVGQLTEKDNAIKERDDKINAMMIDGVFKGSEFINENVAMPRDFFEAAMRNNFKVEDGKVVAYDKTGNRLMSKKTVGEYADPNEALELLVEMHPQKDTILKAPSGNGSGNNGSGGNRDGKGRTVRRADFDAAAPADKAAYGTAVAKGELTIVD
jgi:hypothetical protein